MQNADGVLIGWMALGVLGNPLVKQKMMQIRNRKTTHEICCLEAQFFTLYPPKNSGVIYGRSCQEVGFLRLPRTIHVIGMNVEHNGT